MCDNFGATCVRIGQLQLQIFCKIQGFDGKNFNMDYLRTVSRLPWKDEWNDALALDSNPTSSFVSACFTIWSPAKKDGWDKRSLLQRKRDFFYPNTPDDSSNIC